MVESLFCRGGGVKVKASYGMSGPDDPLTHGAATAGVRERFIAIVSLHLIELQKDL